MFDISFGPQVCGLLDEAASREWLATDGDPPHAATGCPFQAWSVAELLRARRML